MKFELIKIYINARFLAQSVTGVQRYAIEIVKSLDNLITSGEIDSRKFSFILLAPRNIKHKLHLRNIPFRLRGHFTGHLWEQFELPFYAQKGLLVNLCNTAPLLKFNQTVTIHDASVFSFPQAYSFAFRTWYKLLLKLLGITAKKIITDSTFSANELAKYSKIKFKKLAVVYLGREHIFSSKPDCKILNKYNLLNTCFILAVSSKNPAKNFQSIAQAMKLLEDEKFNIVIAGGTNPKVFKKLNFILPANVQEIGYVNDYELRALYEHAACFVYPSFYEGFGLPPLEALTCGCPVIVSNAASLPEVCGDAALYVNPYNPEDIAEKIKLLMNDKVLQLELRQKGLDRSLQFSWEKCAREIMAIIEQVLAR